MTPWLRISEFARRIRSMGVSIDIATLRRWCASGKLPASKFGSVWHVNLQRMIGDIDRGNRDMAMEAMLARGLERMGLR